MTVPLRLQLRVLEIISVGSKEEPAFALRDPDGFAQTMMLPYGAMLLAALIDGQHTLAEIQAEFHRQTGVEAPLADLERVVGHLDESYLLTGDRFDRHRRREIERRKDEGEPDDGENPHAADLW